VIQAQIAATFFSVPKDLCPSLSAREFDHLPIKQEIDVDIHGGTTPSWFNQHHLLAGMVTNTAE
jgi:hypothetical protein